MYLDVMLNFNFKFLKILDKTLSIFCEDFFIIRIRVKFYFKVGVVQPDVN